MTAYPAIDDLEVEIRTGRGIAIILEGDGYEDDPWFYGQWFNDRADEVAFFPQDGWSRVVEAVAELRRRCADVPVYGIIDRDFAGDEELDGDFPQQGILRTPYYTLENYLLEPECWAQVFAFIFRRQGGAPDGWDDPARMHNHIEQAYRDCLPLAAHNQVIQHGNRQYMQQAQQTPEPERIYREHPDAFAGIDPAAKLRAWGQQLGANEDLGDLFGERLQILEQADWLTWQFHVSGKQALRELHRRFPQPPRAGQFSLSHYLNLYLDRCPTPPPDLAALIDRIIEDARR